MAAVGDSPLITLAGVISAVTAPTVTVRVADGLDDNDQPCDVVATGTGAVNDKVTVLLRPNGRATLVKT